MAVSICGPVIDWTGLFKVHKAPDGKIKLQNISGGEDNRTMMTRMMIKVQVQGNTEGEVKELHKTQV